MSDKKSSGGKWALGTLIAGAAGYVAGVLTAPKSGKETREDMKDAAVSGVDSAEKDLKKLHTELNNTVDEAKKELDKLSGKAKDQLKAAADLGTKAKDKAREVLSAAHEGETSDDDLQKAVKEADKALADLKKFLKK